MAILRSTDGKFYDVPDEELGNYEVPADQVKGLLSGLGPAGGGGGGAVRPYSHCGGGGFRNCGFRNCGFRNCGFRNCGSQ